MGLAYFMAYPVLRFNVEFPRGDSIRGFVFGGWLSTSQFISLALFTAALAILAFRLRRARRDNAAEPANLSLPAAVDSGEVRQAA